MLALRLLEQALQRDAHGVVAGDILLELAGLTGVAALNPGLGVELDAAVPDLAVRILIGLLSTDLLRDIALEVKGILHGVGAVVDLLEVIPGNGQKRLLFVRKEAEQLNLIEIFIGYRLGTLRVAEDIQLYHPAGISQFRVALVDQRELQDPLSILRPAQDLRVGDAQIGDVEEERLLFRGMCRTVPECAGHGVGEVRNAISRNGIEHR